MRKRSSYEDIAIDVLARIQAGEYPPGSAIPSYRKLAKMYGVSQATAQSAVRVLRFAGFVYGVAGRGVFVAEQPAGELAQVAGAVVSVAGLARLNGSRTDAARMPLARVSPLRQRLHAMLSVGEADAGTLLKVGRTSATGPVAAALHLPEPAAIVGRHVLVRSGPRPVELRALYLPAGLAAEIGLTGRQPLSDGLLGQFRRRAVPSPHHVVERISARPPTPREATLLELGSRECLLSALWTLRDQQDRALAVAEAAFPTSRAPVEDSFPIP